MKKWLLVLSILIAVMLGSTAGVMAISMFTQKLAGTGSMKFTDEVILDKIKVKSLSEVFVRLDTTVNAVADRVYTVELYGNYNLLDTETVSWSVPELGHKKDVLFTGLSLGPITNFDVDIVY